MKKIFLSVAAAAAFAVPPVMNAQVNSPDAAGYIERGRLMFDDANYRGCIDQMGHALGLTDVPSDREEAEFYYARAAMAVPGMDALPLLEKFLADYPASQRRTQVQLYIGDCYYDRGEWAAALKAYALFDNDCLNPSEAESRNYRLAFCLLKMGEYGERFYQELLNTKQYGNEARFYLGYIAYHNKEYDKAAELFRSVRPGEAPTDMVPYYMAQIYFMRKDYRRALEQAKALLASGAGDAQFRSETERVAGESMYALGDEKGAVDYLRRYASSVESLLPSALYILGVDDFRNGRYEKTIERMTPVTAEHSSIGQSAYLYIGQAYCKLDNYNAATMALDKASRMDYDPQVTETAMYNLAVAGLQGGRVPFGSSVARFEEFLASYPDSRYAPEVEEYVINGYMTDNNPAAALRAVNAIKNPSEKVLAAKQQVLYMLGSRELQTNETAAALAHFLEASRMGSLNATLANECNLWMGECLYRQGKYAEAVKSYKAFIRSASRNNPNLPLAYYDLGYARFAQKQFADAKTDFSRAIESAKGMKSSPVSSNVNLSDAYNRLADSYYYSSDFASAASTYEKAYSLNPKAGDYPMYQQGLMKGLQRDHNGKIEILSAMTSRFPTSSLVPSALLEMGESYGELGRDDRAIETYTALAARYPNTAQGRQGTLLLAMTYLNNGNRAQAIAQYKKVVQNYPTSDEARAASDDLKHLMADEGRLGEYAKFMDNVPNAPKVETAELAALSLESTEKALESGMTETAYDRAVEVIETFPDSPQAVRALAIKGEIEAAQGKAEPALATYRELESRASSSSDMNTARMGILRVCRDLGNHEQVIETADALLESSSLGSSQKSEVAYTKAVALAASGKGSEAVELWKAVGADTDDIYGTKGAFDLAQYYFENGRTDDALAEVNRLIDANPPHDYWLARGFILLSDIQRKQGKTFEADEYLKSLKENYPGTETDIFQMIETRLKD